MLDTVYTNLLKMMKNRGHDTSPHENKSNITSESFNITFPNDGNKLFVFYLSDLKIGINNIKQVFDTLSSENAKTCIIIYQNIISSFAKQHIEHSDFDLQMFSVNQLQKDIYSHCLVPKHELMSDADKLLFLKHLKINETNLPKIKKTDPISQYFGAKSGSLFRIIRYEQGIQSMSYRICI